MYINISKKYYNRRQQYCIHPTTLSGANFKNREGSETRRPSIPETIYKHPGGSL